LAWPSRSPRCRAAWNAASWRVMASPRGRRSQQPGEGGGQDGNPGVLAGGGGVVQAGEQAGPLSAGPGQRLLTAGQRGNRGRDRALRGGRAGAGLAGDEGGGVLVVIQQPGGRQLPVPVRIQAIGQDAGVLADQVTHPVPPVGEHGQQVLVVQRLQAMAGDGQLGAVQGGSGVAVDLGARVQAQPPDAGPDPRATGRTPRRPTGSRSPSAPAGPPPRRGRMVPRLSGHRPDRQRRVPAQPGDLGHPRIARAQPWAARQPD